MEQYAETAADVGSVYVEREHQCRSRYAVPQAEVYAEVVATYHPTQEHIYAFGGRAFVDVGQVFLYSCGVGQCQELFSEIFYCRKYAIVSCETFGKDLFEPSAFEVNPF